MFKQLTEAYNVLSNEHRRKQYDSSLGISKVGPALMAPSRSSVVHASAGGGNSHGRQLSTIDIVVSSQSVRVHRVTLGLACLLVWSSSGASFLWWDGWGCGERRQGAKTSTRVQGERLHSIGEG